MVRFFGLLLIALAVGFMLAAPALAGPPVVKLDAFPVEPVAGSIAEPQSLQMTFWPFGRRRRGGGRGGCSGGSCDVAAPAACYVA